MPTWSEFLTIAAANGVRRRASKISVVDPDGKEIPIQYLVKEGYPPFIHPRLRPSDQLTPVLLGSLCRRFDIDPKPFGVSLADLPSDI